MDYVNLCANIDRAIRFKFKFSSRSDVVRLRETILTLVNGEFDRVFKSRYAVERNEHPVVNIGLKSEPGDHSNR